MAFWNKRRKQDDTAASLMSANMNTWSYRTIGKSVLSMDVIRASVDAIARNIAKADLRVVKDKDGQKVSVKDDVSKVLKKPNPYMTTYDFLYKCTALFLTTNNLFIYPDYDDNGRLVALWPVNYQSAHIYNVKGTLIVRFQLMYTREYTCPYSSLIHLRNHYMTDDLMGESNSAIEPVAELLNAQNQGIINGIKNSAIIRGILKATGVIKTADLEKTKKQFVADNLATENSGGVIALDGKYDYKNIDSKPYVIDADLMKESRQMVCDYFGISEKFLDGSIDPDGYESIYETRLKPWLIQLCQGLTDFLYGQSSKFSIEPITVRVKYQTLTQSIQIVKATSQLGLFTRNEYRGMFGAEPLPAEQGGNEILIATNNYGPINGAGNGNDGDAPTNGGDNAATEGNK